MQAPKVQGQGLGVSLESLSALDLKMSRPSRAPLHRPRVSAGVRVTNLPYVNLPSPTISLTSVVLVGTPDLPHLPEGHLVRGPRLELLSKLLSHDYEDNSTKTDTSPKFPEPYIKIGRNSYSWGFGNGKAS